MPLPAAGTLPRRPYARTDKPSPSSARARLYRPDGSLAAMAPDLAALAAWAEAQGRTLLGLLAQRWRLA